MNSYAHLRCINHFFMLLTRRKRTTKKEETGLRKLLGLWDSRVLVSEPVLILMLLAAWRPVTCLVLDAILLTQLGAILGLGL
jgi:hypothetical protein